MTGLYSQYISVSICPLCNLQSCFYFHIMWYDDTLYKFALMDIWVDAGQGQRFNGVTSLILFFLAFMHSSYCSWRSFCAQTHVSSTLICSSFNINKSKTLPNHLMMIKALAFQLLLKISFSFSLSTLCCVLILCFGLQLHHKERFCTGQRCRCACAAAWRLP